MTRIIEDIPAHYETHEVPFGRSYEWHPERILFECDCGQMSTVTATSPANTSVPSHVPRTAGMIAPSSFPVNSSPLRIGLASSGSIW